MNNVNIRTSFIIAKYEAAFLMSGRIGTHEGAAARYILDKLLTDSFSEQDAIEGLTLKSMAHMEGAVLRLEPVVDFLLQEVLKAQEFWILEKIPALIIKTPSLWILITAYTLTKNTCRITPYQDGIKIAEVLRETYEFNGPLEFL